MSNSNTTGSRKTRKRSVETLKNATKGSARDLTKVVIDYRGDKSTPSKACNAMNRAMSSCLVSNALDAEEKCDALNRAAEVAKAEAEAAIDRQLSRAITLANVKRGTTGKGGIHWQDVVVELVGNGGKRVAVENNDKALRSAGLIS